MKSAIRAAGMVIVAFFAPAGCVAPGGTTVPQITRVANYPQCYRSVALLRYQDEQFAQVMAANTVAGAAAGALAGAVASRGDSTGALIGAAVGGLIAANMTYASIRQQQPDNELRRGLIANDMYHDSSELQRAVVAARQADYCYSAAYNQLVAGLRSGAVSKAEAAQRFTEIDQGEREATAILAEYGKKTAASVQQYEVAFNQEAQRSNITPAQLLAGAGAQSLGPHGPEQQLSKNTSLMVQNYRTISQQVSEFNHEQQSRERRVKDQRDYMHDQGVDVYG
jgi:hypothetical protein